MCLKSILFCRFMLWMVRHWQSTADKAIKWNKEVSKWMLGSDNPNPTGVFTMPKLIYSGPWRVFQSWRMYGAPAADSTLKTAFWEQPN